MSRLQVGGLALVTHDKYSENVGVTVELIKYVGYQETFSGNNYEDGWLVSGVSTSLKAQDPNGGWSIPVDKAVTSAKNLMPLGDKKTQDELAKEVEDV